jgi:hypothetical protein
MNSGASRPVDRLKLVEHPRHVLRRRPHVRRGDVDFRSEAGGDLSDPATAQAFLFVETQGTGVTFDKLLW